LNANILSVDALSAKELLLLHTQIGERLREKGVLRSANNPTGDLAEHLFCIAFGWQLANNSVKGYDALSSDGKRFQIKGRRVHRRNPSRQLSAIRDIVGNHFDFLAAVLFDDDYGVTKAILLPKAAVAANSTFTAHTNSHKFMLKDECWSYPNAVDVTEKLRAALKLI
jgi:hypothetical protein